MKVSIITPVFNGSKTLEETLHSILEQDHPDIEYIVIDGGSTDGTLDMLARYQDRIARCISEPDTGLYDAVNKGIKLSTGDIVATLNSDDIYADKTIVSQMVEFMQNNHLDAAYGDLVYIETSNKNRITRFWKTGEYRKGAFGCGWVMPHPTFFCRKELFEKYGYFNETFRIAGDFELMLRFVEKHQVKLGYLPRVLVKMTTGGRANVFRGMIRGNYEILKSFRINGVFLSPLYFIAKPAAKVLQLFRRPPNSVAESHIVKTFQT